MAAPVVSGIAALIIQQYRKSYAGNDPLPSTVKALLVHGAVDLDNASSFYNPGPDYASGYGRIDAKASIDLVKDGKVRENVINADDEVHWYSVQVTSSSQPLKVTLSWDDWEGSPLAATTLVNDLDLSLYYGNKEGLLPDHLPWKLDHQNPSTAASKDWNSVDPLEQVLVNNPTPGTYFIKVHGWNVPTVPQKYSLVSEHFPISDSDEEFPWILFYPAFIKKR
jgi:hypothetical protein